MGDTVMNREDKLALSTQAIAASSSCKEFKEAAQNYIDALDTENEAQAAKALVAEAEEDINTIDDTIAFLGSDFAAELLGAERAAQMLEHSMQLKADGAIYCDCPGCVAAKEIINLKAEILN